MIPNSFRNWAYDVETATEETLQFLRHVQVSRLISCNFSFVL
jgi:hypothetical protein